MPYRFLSRRETTVERIGSGPATHVLTLECAPLKVFLYCDEKLSRVVEKHLFLVAVLLSSHGNHQSN